MQHKEIIQKDKSFKITLLEIYDGVLKGLKINFKNDKQLDSKDFSSIIIGENGVGKSILLRTIIDIFLELERLKKVYNGEKNRKSSNVIKSYRIQYTIGEDKYVVEKLDKGINIYHNEEILRNYNNLKLPQKVMACSFLINDKFIFSKNENDSIYKYLGVRVHNTMTNTSLVVKKIALNIINSINNEEFIAGIIECFKFLNLYPECKLVYKIKQKQLFFSGDVTTKNIFEKFDVLWSKRSTQAFGYNIIKELKNKPEDLYDMVNLINEISYKIGNEKELSFNVNFKDINTMFLENTNVSILEKLSKLDIITNPDIYIKRNEEYSLENGSSGEIHILFLITNILSQIGSESLILIDEPEVSLHPNWQIKIMSLLEKILKQCSSTNHVIVATHSHFMVSDLNQENSSVIVMNKINNKINNNITSEVIYENTYGWSAENILYKVFNVPSNRNYYLADELDNILEEISMGNISCVKDRILKLKHLLPNLTENDPLKEVIEKILEKAVKYE
ncbi:AAA family ATPase [Clostridium butyricum]|uniref:AAA family ATPase n=1 Tax=Clostridium butyricum TaxID=1492 RepID=UPI00374F6AFB